jgi:hypothetical protein
VTDISEYIRGGEEQRDRTDNSEHLQKLSVRQLIGAVDLVQRHGAGALSLVPRLQTRASPHTSRRFALIPCAMNLSSSREQESGFSS